MRRAAALLLVLSNGVMVLAQNPPRDTQAITVPSGTAAMSGTVVDDDGKPMRHVSVMFEGDARANRTALTDDQGRFSVSGMPAARYTIRAEKPGYPSVSYGAKRPGRPGSGLLVKDGAAVDGIVLHMSRGAVITGTLYDHRGRPLPGASVTVYSIETTLSGEFYVSPISRSGSAFLLTDDLGTFRFYGLPAGEYIVGTSPIFTGLNAAVRIPTDAEIREAFGLAARARAISTDLKPPAPIAPPLSNYAQVFFGDVNDPAVATRIRVAAGEVRADVDLHLTLQSTATISGEVQGPVPTVPPIQMQLVRRTRVPGTFTFINRPQQGATFVYVNEPPGDYLLVARTEDTPVLWAEMPVTISGSDVTGLRLSLQPAMTASGRVIFNGRSLPPPDPSKVAIAPALVSTNDFRFAGAAVVGSAFDFTFNDLVPGRFRVAATVRDVVKPGAPEWTLASVMLGDRDVTDLPVEVQAGVALPPITVTFTDSPSDLSGTLMTADGKPATDYFVVVLAADERYWVSGQRRIRSTRPDADGHYAFPSLPPGAYRVAATTDLERGDLTSLTFLRDLMTTSAPVIVGAGEKKVFDLKLGGTR